MTEGRTAIVVDLWYNQDNTVDSMKQSVHALLRGLAVAFFFETMREHNDWGQ